MKVRDYIENTQKVIRPISFFYIKKILKDYDILIDPKLKNLYLYKSILNDMNLSSPKTFPNIRDISEEIYPIIYDRKTIKLEEKLKKLLDLVSNFKDKKFVYVNKNELSEKVKYDDENEILFSLYCQLGYDRQDRVNLEKLSRCIEYFINEIQEVLSKDIDELKDMALINKEDIKYISYVHDQLSTNDKKYKDIDEFMKDCFLSINSLTIKSEYKLKLKEILISIALPCVPICNIMVNSKCYSMHAFRSDIKDNIKHLIKVIDITVD